MDIKRLFFALEIHSFWPETLPQGRILAEKDRHLTLAFLGNIDFSKLPLKDLPLPEFKVGFCGKFDQCLFLPKKHPRVVAWHADWLENVEPLQNYHNILNDWLKEKGFPADSKHDFLPHVTLSRAPFDLTEWKQCFNPLPFFASSLHLCESLGNLNYASIWSHIIKPPFEEIEHTADIGYLVRGETREQLFIHAFIALCFTFPDLLAFWKKDRPENVQDIVIALNNIVSKADQEIGCPFKAVSFHGNIKEKNGLLEWEMIIDV